MKTIIFKIELPAEISDKEVIEYLKYELGLDDKMSGNNPLANYDLAELNPSNLEVKK